MKLREATKSDIPELCALLNSLFSQEVEFRPNLDLQAQALDRIIADEQLGVILLAESRAKVIGMINLLYTLSTALGSRVALLEDMVVSEEVRGIGVGSKLIEYAIDFAKIKGCRRITLLTDYNNLKAQSFYKKHGFEASTMRPYRYLID